MAKLTKKQKMFVEEYLIDLNATQAAIRAGYSVSSARDIGCENLTKPNIKEVIDKKMAERSRRLGISADRVVAELAKIGFVNVSHCVDVKTGKVRDDASEEDLAAIQSIKIREMDNDFGSSKEVEVKFCDKKGALELLGKHLGIFKDKLSVEGELPVVIKDDVPEEEPDEQN